MSTNFDINRVYYLLKRQARLSGIPLLIGSGVVAGLMILIFTLSQFDTTFMFDDTRFLSTFLPFVFVGGCVFTSAIFYEINSPNRGYLYLSLPASTLEKLIASWFLTSIVYIVYAVIVMFITNVIVDAFGLLIRNHGSHIVNFFAPWVLLNFLVYLIIQPIFLLGALYFKRVNFLKTLLAVFLICIAIIIYTAIAARIIVFDNMADIHFDASTSPAIKMFAENVIVPIAKWFFWICMAPYFLIVSYFRLKERQV